MDIFVPFHQHLLIKCYVKNPPVEVDVLNKWLINLVETVGMRVLAGPTTAYVDDLGNEGLTGTITLSTSHSSLHVWSEYKLPMIQFDLYSCKSFKLDDVIKCFIPWGLIKVEWIMIDRNEFPVITSQGTIDYPLI